MLLRLTYLGVTNAFALLRLYVRKQCCAGTGTPSRNATRPAPALFDTVLADAGIQVVLSGVRIPRMNAIMER